MKCEVMLELVVGGRSSRIMRKADIVVDVEMI